eukprot:11200686-Lingulodinium_polyedra.AAC.1
MERHPSAVEQLRQDGACVPNTHAGEFAGPGRLQEELVHRVEGGDLASLADAGQDGLDAAHPSGRDHSEALIPHKLWEVIEFDLVGPCSKTTAPLPDIELQSGEAGLRVVRDAH